MKGAPSNISSWIRDWVLSKQKGELSSKWTIYNGEIFPLGKISPIYLFLEENSIPGIFFTGGGGVSYPGPFYREEDL